MPTILQGISCLDNHAFHEGQLRTSITKESCLYVWSLYLHNTSIDRDTSSLWSFSLKFFLISWHMWSFKSVWFHGMVWHHIKPCHVVVNINTLKREKGLTLCDNLLVPSDSQNPPVSHSYLYKGLWGESQNNLQIVKVAQRSLRKIKIHKRSSTYQSSI